MDGVFVIIIICGAPCREMEVIIVQSRGCLLDMIDGSTRNDAQHHWRSKAHSSRVQVCPIIKCVDDVTIILQIKYRNDLENLKTYVILNFFIRHFEFLSSI